MAFCSNKSYHFSGKKFQSAISADNSKQIGDSYHLDKKRGTETTENLFYIHAINDSENHGKCHTEDTYVTVSYKTDDNCCKKQN